MEYFQPRFDETFTNVSWSESYKNASHRSNEQIVPHLIEETKSILSYVEGSLNETLTADGNIQEFSRRNTTVDTRPQIHVQDQQSGAHDQGAIATSKSHRYHVNHENGYYTVGVVRIALVFGLTALGKHIIFRTFPKFSPEVSALYTSFELTKMLLDALKRAGHLDGLEASLRSIPGEAVRGLEAFILWARQPRNRDSLISWTRRQFQKSFTVTIKPPEPHQTLEGSGSSPDEHEPLPSHDLEQPPKEPPSCLTLLTFLLACGKKVGFFHPHFTS